MPRRSSERTSAFQSSTARVWTSLGRRPLPATSASSADVRNWASSLLLQLAAEARLDLLAQLGDRVEPGGPGEVIVDGGSTFS